MLGINPGAELQEHKRDEWEKRCTDNILVVIYDENLRQGGARNIGLSYATGDFIGFVDSDDRIELDMYRLLEPENADIYVVKLKWLRSWLKNQGIEL